MYFYFYFCIYADMIGCAYVDCSIIMVLAAVILFLLRFTSFYMLSLLIIVNVHVRDSGMEQIYVYVYRVCKDGFYNVCGVFDKDCHDWSAHVCVFGRDGIVNGVFVIS